MPYDFRFTVLVILPTSKPTLKMCWAVVMITV